MSAMPGGHPLSSGGHDVLEVFRDAGEEVVLKSVK